MMDQWDSVANERLFDLVRLPTVAWEAPFAGASRGWKLDRGATFAQAEAYLTRWLMTFSNQVSTQDVVIDGRTLRNIWARVPGADSTRAILLEGHYDVVALNGNFSPSISADGQRILGRGTCDMKGGVVTGLLTLEDMVRSEKQPRVDTYILLTCEEEVEARAIQAFLAQKPDWCDKVEFAVNLEPCFQGDEFQICTRHPGISCLEVSIEVLQAGEHGHWFDVRIETGETTPHSSREPAYLDPNFVLLKVLGRLPRSLVALVESDRPMEKEANAISSFAHAMVSAELDEAALREICEQEIEAAIERIVDDERRRNARNYKLSVASVTESRPAFDVREFADVLLELKRQATDKRYTNALYGRTPFTFAILDVQNGAARAKIDLRPDDRLGDDLESLAAKEASTRWAINIKWNDPGLELPGIEKNVAFQRFLDCCRQVFPQTVPTPHSGWTEAAFMSKSLGIPVVVAGPGQMHLTHKQEEYIALDEMRTVYAMLQAFLS
jgi:acetylornithine deacetylase/succinyl-diaminopimelate desuccinylase-like protein